MCQIAIPRILRSIRIEFAIHRKQLRRHFISAPSLGEYASELRSGALPSNDANDFHNDLFRLLGPYPPTGEVTDDGA
jgi:hypothetical protein